MALPCRRRSLVAGCLGVMIAAAVGPRSGAAAAQLTALSDRSAAATTQLSASSARPGATAVPLKASPYRSVAATAQPGALPGARAAADKTTALASDAPGASGEAPAAASPGQPPAATSKPKAHLAPVGYEDRPERSAAAPGERSWFTPKDSPHTKRSDILVPMVSFLLPGFGQYINGEYLSGAVYSAAAVAGYAYAGQVKAHDHLAHQQDVLDQRAEEHDDKKQSVLAQKDIAVRKYTLGLLVAQGAGGISLYHSFRTAVASRRASGEYQFLKRDETPMELFAAPFHYQYLKRPTTYIPLLIGGAIAMLQLHLDPGKDMVRSRYNGADAVFTSSFSYNAGTHEEAIFRGWLMPEFREYGANDVWANVGQSVLFAAAHLNTNATPLPQLLLGYHLGYVSQKNLWQLGEGVFIHVWWDVIAFWAQYQYTWKYAGKDQASLPPPVLWAPPFEWHF